MVQDANGNVVYTGAGDATAGEHVFNWNGQTNSGTQLPDGTYKLTVTATAGDGTAVSTQVASQGTVTEVDLTGSEPTLMIGSRWSVPLSKADPRFWTTRFRTGLPRSGGHETQRSFDEAALSTASNQGALQ